MSDQSDKLVHLLKPFGLDTHEAEIYLLLLKNQPMTALTLSRQLHLARTRVYRILDKLIAKGLIRQKLAARGLRFEAVSHTQLEALVLLKEQEAKMLKESLPFITKELAQVAAQGKNRSKVLYYSGIEGLKQIQWNSTKAHGELLIYEIKNMAAFLEYDFCEEVRERLVENRIFVREITNQKRVEDWTEVTQLVKKYWQVRYLDPQKLEIQFEVMIYNDVYTMYSYLGNEIFCVEIYNNQLAHMQKQLFDFIWQAAAPLKIINEHGVAEVVN